MTSRRLRSTAKHIETPPSSEPASLLIPSITWSREGNGSSSCTVQPSSQKLVDLSKRDLAFLRKKQKKLRYELVDTEAIVLECPDHFRTSLASTLIFAQESAGTAICISPNGLVLTCSHCIAESKDEFKQFTSTWLLTYDGIPVQAKCLAWDSTRDLALLQIVSMEDDAAKNNKQSPRFSSVLLGDVSQKNPIYCIGQPGRDDLESSTARKTTYQLVEISRGHLRGYVAGADLQDNSDIGSLKHDAWTYWGHSGAPLLNSNDGKLLGLHSSWDDKTAMRHGVPLIAIYEFLKDFVDSTTYTARNEIEELLNATSCGLGSPT